MHYRIVNCAPARRCVWPDIGRHGRVGGRGVWRRGGAVLLRRFACGSRLSFFPCQEKKETACGRLRFCSARVGIAIRAFSDVLRLSGFVGSLRDGAVLLRRFVCGSRLSFFLVRKKETACGVLRFYSARVGITLQRSQRSCGYRALWVHFRVKRFLWRSRRTGDGSATRRSAFLRNHIGHAMLSAGSTLGLRAPDCAKEPLALWTLFMWVAAWVRKAQRRPFGCSAAASERPPHSAPPASPRGTPAHTPAPDTAPAAARHSRRSRGGSAWTACSVRTSAAR